VDRVAEQPDRASQHRQEQLGQARGRQAGRADRHRPVRRTPFLRVVTGAGQLKRRGRVTQPRNLMHPARMTAHDDARQIPLTAGCAMLRRRTPERRGGGLSIPFKPRQL
jgi:hypothetical protein